MNKYVAFLRAVNVGGHTILKMADPKRMFELPITTRNLTTIQKIIEKFK